MAAQHGQGAGVSNGRVSNGRATDRRAALSSPDPGDTLERGRAVPEASVGRLAVYLRVLSAFAESGTATLSSEELAAAAGVNPAKLRKDLSYLGSHGTRGVGYEVAVLIEQIELLLGLTRYHRVAVVGIGNLGHALANYDGFPGRGFPVGALFDVEQDLIGVPVGGIEVDHIDDIVEVCLRRRISIGVIATPVPAAQAVADRLVAAGVRCILNFAPVVLRVPADVEVRKVDLAVELQILSFHATRRADAQRDDGAASVMTQAGLDPAKPAEAMRGAEGAHTERGTELPAVGRNGVDRMVTSR